MHLSRLIVSASAALASSLALACATVPASNVSVPGPPAHDFTALDPLAQKAHTLLTERRFAELDSLAAKLRAKDSIGKQLYRNSYWFYKGLALDQASNECGASVKPASRRDQETGLVQEWVRALPKSAPARITLARHQRDLAWQIRGDTYVSGVSEEQWRGFRAKIAEAMANMAAIKSPSERESQYYFVMIPLAIDAGWNRKRFAALHDEAFKRFPYHIGLYITSAGFYTAKWGGSQREFDAFIERAVQSTRAIMGDGLYAHIHYDNQDNDMFNDGRVSWPRMHAAFQRIALDFPEPQVHNRHASVACNVEDIAVLKEEFAIIKDQLVASLFGGADNLKICQELAKGNLCFRRSDTNALFCRPK